MITYNNIRITYYYSDIALTKFVVYELLYLVLRKLHNVAMNFEILKNHN